MEITIAKGGMMSDQTITEEWLRSIGFAGGRNPTGPSCGRTWAFGSLTLDCYRTFSGDEEVLVCRIKGAPSPCVNEDPFPIRTRRDVLLVLPCEASDYAVFSLYEPADFSQCGF